MSKYSEYFLNSKSSIIQLELIEISHSAFTKIYRIVRNATAGVTVTLEDNTIESFDYYPLSITPIAANDDLDQSLKISLGDLGEVLPKELDAVSSANGFLEKPIVKYRIYRSDDLENVLVGPLILEVKTFSFNREGSTFEAKAPSVNINKTGELYKINRFPMLRGFL
jgi:hypothetical protein